MTRTETAQIMAVLKVAFPSWYKGLTREDAIAAVNLWADLFADDPADEVAAAVKSLIATQKEGYPPTIGAVKAQLDKLRTGNRMTDEQAWRLIYKAICNSAHNSGGEFAKLPPELQRIVGSPNQLRDWALMDADTVNSVVASNVQRAYRTRTEAEREMRVLPASVKSMLTGIADRWALPEAKEDADWAD